jgi:hypothetical protein
MGDRFDKSLESGVRRLPFGTRLILSLVVALLLAFGIHVRTATGEEVAPPVKDKAVALEEPKEEVPAEIAPFGVLHIEARTVDVLFKGFVRNPFTRRVDVKFIWGTGARTDYVAVGESYRGYKVYPFESRVEEVKEPGQPPAKKKRFFLTLKKEEENPIVIEAFKTAQITERVATLEAGEGQWLVLHRNERFNLDEDFFEVFDGCVIAERGGDKRKFTVTRVGDKTVVLDGKDRRLLRVSSE